MAKPKKKQPAKTTTRRRRAAPVTAKKGYKYRRPGASGKSIKDLLVDGLCSVGGAIVASMVSKAIIKAKPTATDPVGEESANKMRSLVTAGIGIAGVMMGKKSKLLAAAGTGAITYGGLSAVKSFFPNQKFLGAEIDGEEYAGESQLAYQAGYSPEAQLMGTTIDMAADEIAAEMDGEEISGNYKYLTSRNNY